MKKKIFSGLGGKKTINMFPCIQFSTKLHEMAYSTDSMLVDNLPQKSYYLYIIHKFSLHERSVCQIRNHFDFKCFFVFFFFSTETDDWWCTQFVEPTVWFPPQKQRRGSVTRGPRILVDLVGTHYLARFVHFHFLKFCLHLCVLTSTTDVQFFLEPPGSILLRAALKQLGQKRAPDLGRFSPYSLFGPLCSVSFLKFCLHLGATLISQ